MNCFVGIDIGTSAIKCILISEHGKILGHAKEKNSLICPLPGRVEFDVDKRYDQICWLIKSLLKNKTADSKVLAVCITGATGNTLLLDHQKKPIGNAVSWQDGRAESTYQTLLAPFSSKYVHSVCGWPKIGSFPLASFSWMKENEPDVYHSAKYYVTDFIYFNYRLSGSWAMDTSTATNFYLQDQVRMKYHQPFLDFLKIREESLPEIVRSGEQIGKITRQASLETNLPEETIVVAGAFDHPSAARGTGMTKVGDLLLSCGTSWVGFFPIDSREKILEKEMLIDPFLTPNGPWGAMFSLISIGDIINQYVNLLFDNAIDSFAKFDQAVLASFPTSGALCFNLLQKEFSPEMYLLAMLKSHSVPEISRSIMECMAKMMREKIEYFENSGMLIKNVTLVGGFAKSKAWPQVLANYLNMPIKLNNCDFAGCIGAVILAGMGVGLFENESDAYRKLNITSTQLTPNS